MNNFLFLLTALNAVFVVAHDAHDAPHLIKRHFQARQAPAASSASQSQAASAPAGTPTGSASATGSGTPAPASITVSLASTNPTAVPLSSIIANAPSAPTHTFATFTPGTQPTGISGAPGLPDVSLLKPSDYPTLDRPPPEDSPEVDQWFNEVMNSGIVIPDIGVNNVGGCPNNTAAASNSSNCWWTCTGCTATTDVTECPDKLTWGLTYDDGPSLYTPDLLNYLDEQKLKTTFFVVGSRVISFPQILQAEYMAGHQIAVHTWSHFPLTTLSTRQIIAEFGWSKKVIFDTIGITPNMMRPPYGDIDNRVRAIAAAMGLTPVMWTRISPTATFDTDDFDIHGGLTDVQTVLGNWKNILGNVSTRDTGFIVLEHDLFQESVEVATGYILPDALAHNPPFTIQPVIECLHLPMSDAYIQSNDNKTNPPLASGATLSSGAPGSAQATGGQGGGSQALTINFALAAFGIVFALGSSLL